MKRLEHIAQLLFKALTSPTHRPTIDDSYLLGEDTAKRAQIAFEILSKALDTTKLVRVERPCSRNGKTFMKHMWVRPDQVKKGDTVVGNKALYEQWKKAQTKSDSAAKAPKEQSKKPTNAKAPDKNTGMLAKLKAFKDKQGAADKQKAEAKPKQETKPKTETKQKAAIFSEGVVSEEAVRKVYAKANLDEFDDLSSDESYRAALEAIQELEVLRDRAFQKADFESDDLYFPTNGCIGAVYKQHNVALHGKAAVEAEITRTNDAFLEQVHDNLATSFMGPPSPAFVAATIDAWKRGAEYRARENSPNHITDGLLAQEYTSALAAWISLGKPQEDTLYCSASVSKDDLKQMLTSNTFRVEGIRSTTKEPTVAQERAKEQGSASQLKVVFELLPSTDRPTLEIGGSTPELLIRDYGSNSVESIRKDAEGVYHVALGNGELGAHKPIADEAIYSAFGVQRPADFGRLSSKERKERGQKRFEHPDVKGAYRAHLESRFEQGDKQARLAYDMYVGAGTGIKDAHYVPPTEDDPTAFFSPAENAVYMNVDKDADGHTFFHEHGHMVDFNAGDGYPVSMRGQYRFKELLKDDFKKLFAKCRKAGLAKWREEKKAELEANPSLAAMWKKAGRNVMKAKPLPGTLEEYTWEVMRDYMSAVIPEDYPSTLERARIGADDIISGITMNQYDYRLVAGHKHKYWSEPGALEIEAFAQMYDACFDPVKTELMQMCFPKGWKAFRKMLKDIT